MSTPEKKLQPPLTSKNLSEKAGTKNITKQSTQGISNEIRSIVLTLWLSEGCEKNTVKSTRGLCKLGSRDSQFKGIGKESLNGNGVKRKYNSM